MFNNSGRYGFKHEGVCYVVLGHDCNFNCKYCIEHGNSYDERRDIVINPDIYAFIRKFPGVITFYGGEPFVYFDQIREVVSNCGDEKHYATMTNGSLIGRKEVQFINHNCISVNLSWDGERTKETRIRDAVEENWNNLVNIDDLWITSVISKYNYPRDLLKSIDVLDRSYYKKHGYHLRFYMEPVIKTFESSFFDMDLDRLRSEVTDILLNPQNFYEALLGVYVNNLHIYDEPRYLEKCGAGFANVAISLEGDLYYCKNSNIKLGKLSEIKDYHQRVLNGDKNIFKDECLNCSISRICLGGCRINNYRSDFCATQKAFFEPVIDYYMGR